MLTALSGINFLYSSDDKRIKIKDSYINLEKRCVEQFVCQIGGYLFSRNILVSPLLINDYGGQVLEQRYQLFVCEEKLQSFRDQNSVKTQSQSYKEYSRSMLKNIVYDADSFLSPYNISQLRRVRDKKIGNTLFSLKELDGYLIESLDNSFGTFFDFLVDPKTWELKHIVVDLGLMFNRDLRVVPMHLIKEISWPTLSVTVDLRDTFAEDLPSVPQGYCSAGVIYEKDMRPINANYKVLKNVNY